MATTDNEEQRAPEKDNTCYLANISDFMSLWTGSSFDRMLSPKRISLSADPKMPEDTKKEKKRERKSKLRESVQ